MKKLLCFCLIILSSFSLSSFSAEDEWQNVERVVAVGDIHGDYEQFVAVLNHAEVINRRGNWNAGTTHLVQVGDLPDRGPDTHKIIELLRKLERQAARAGGRVHTLIGNHEAMNMLGDLRYVHPGEYAALRSREAARLRDNYYQRELAWLKQTQPELSVGPDHREQWEQRIPLGYVEHRIAWSADGDFGKWVLEHNAIIKINRTLFVHGGIGPELLGRSIREINEQIREELRAGETGMPGLAESEQGPLWYRGLASNDESSEAPHVDALLAYYDVDRIVIGHTPGYGTIVPRFGGRVLMIDTGISAWYGAHLASLIIEGDTLLNNQRGKLLTIPTGDTDPLPYFREAAALEPAAAGLQRLINRLQE
jgi:hypothetical protein